MFIGDWGRQEDQWRWATFEEGDNKIYKPIPRDRDQAYTRLDGVLLSLGIAAAGAGHLETFNYNIKDRLDVGASANFTYNEATYTVNQQLSNKYFSHMNNFCWCGDLMQEDIIFQFPISVQ